MFDLSRTPRTLRGAWVAMFLGVAAVTSASPARAESKAVELRVQGTCSREDDLWRLIERRTQRLERAPRDDRTADVVEIEIGTGADGIVDGSFRILANGDVSEVRSMRGTSCEEVVEGLSLMIALAYDANAKIAPVEEPRASTLDPSSTVAPPQGAVRSSDGGRGGRTDQPLASPRLLWTTGAHAFVALSDANPRGIDVFGEVASSRGPSARLAASLAHTTVDVAPSTARFLWVNATPEGCPLTLRRGALSVTPCAGVSLGVLHAASAGSPRATQFTRAWFAPRVAVRLQMALLPGLAIEGGAALEVPLLRDRYGFEEKPAYEVPAVLPLVSLGLRVSFDR